MLKTLQQSYLKVYKVTFDKPSVCSLTQGGKYFLFFFFFFHLSAFKHHVGRRWKLILNLKKGGVVRAGELAEAVEGCFTIWPNASSGLV